MPALESTERRSSRSEERRGRFAAGEPPGGGGRARRHRPGPGNRLGADHRGGARRQRPVPGDPGAAARRGGPVRPDRTQGGRTPDAVDRHRWLGGDAVRWQGVRRDVLRRRHPRVRPGHQHHHQARPARHRAVRLRPGHRTRRHAVRRYLPRWQGLPDRSGHSHLHRPGPGRRGPDLRPLGLRRTRRHGLRRDRSASPAGRLRRRRDEDRDPAGRAARRVLRLRRGRRRRLDRGRHRAVGQVRPDRPARPLVVPDRGDRRPHRRHAAAARRRGAADQPDLRVAVQLRHRRGQADQAGVADPVRRDPRRVRRRRPDRRGVRRRLGLVGRPGHRRDDRRRPAHGRHADGAGAGPVGGVARPERLRRRQLRSAAARHPYRQGAQAAHGRRGQTDGRGRRPARISPPIRERSSTPTAREPAR